MTDGEKIDIGPGTMFTFTVTQTREYTFEMPLSEITENGHGINIDDITDAESLYEAIDENVGELFEAFQSPEYEDNDEVRLESASFS